MSSTTETVTELYSPSPLKIAPNVDVLLHQVDQLQNSVNSDVVERLLEENAWLEHSIDRGKEKWQSTTKLLREAFEAYVVLNACIEQLEQETRELDEKWAGDFQKQLSEISPPELSYQKASLYSPVAQDLHDD
ncbi:hypothetical protein PV08_12016 [Exophiala spinifera]|uniref:Uncharacterized protein n=1 Tax=Exophiala spinifera TaxID=91928 RepID=A0A0D1Z9R9_9EURO|nr:uncharacterized protein PV08_12016 [Exophiala spinifera]KIW09732.1 hypothetical protein PV08_12016 [Exophiala spinifera]